MIGNTGIIITLRGYLRLLGPLRFLKRSFKTSGLQLEKKSWKPRSELARRIGYIRWYGAAGGRHYGQHLISIEQKPPASMGHESFHDCSKRLYLVCWCGGMICHHITILTGWSLLSSIKRAFIPAKEYPENQPSKQYSPLFCPTCWRHECVLPDSLWEIMRCCCMWGRKRAAGGFKKSWKMPVLEWLGEPNLWNQLKAWSILDQLLLQKRRRKCGGNFL